MSTHASFKRYAVHLDFDDGQVYDVIAWSATPAGAINLARIDAKMARPFGNWPGKVIREVAIEQPEVA